MAAAAVAAAGHASSPTAAGARTSSSLLHAFWSHVMKMPMDRQTDAGQKVRTCFQYPGDKVGLRFEYDKFAQQQQQQQHQQQQQLSPKPAHPALSTESNSNGVAVPTVTVAPGLPTSPTTGVTLLVYVDSVVDFCSRAREAGFVVYVEPLVVLEEPCVVRSAVLLDPLGVRVRLMEGDVYGLNKLRARGRLGYVSIPVRDYSAVELCMRFFADVFRPTRAARSSSSILTAANVGLDGTAGATGSLEPAAAVGTAIGTSSKGLFRLVDMERFVSDLRTHVWLANGARKKHVAVCLVHRVQRKPFFGEQDQDDDHDGGGGDEAERAAAAERKRVAALSDANFAAQEAREFAGDETNGGGAISGSSGGNHSAATASNAPSSKVFLGLSFMVPDIESSLAFLRSTDTPAAAAAAAAAAIAAATATLSGASAKYTAVSSSSSPSAAALASAPLGVSGGAQLEVQHLPGFPRFVSFTDASGTLNLELSDGAMLGGGGGGGGAGVTTGAADGGGHGEGDHAAGLGGSASAAAMLIRSNMVRAAQAAAAQAAASMASTRSGAMNPFPPSQPQPAVRRPLPTGTAGLSALSSPSRSPLSSAGGQGHGGDDWSDGEGHDSGRPARSRRRSNRKSGGGSIAGGQGGDGSGSDVDADADEEADEDDNNNSLLSFDTVATAKQIYTGGGTSFGRREKQSHAASRKR
jgi:hypothetical protein